MISYEFKYWTGDRSAGTISDEFIYNEAMARARAIQELCETFKIIIKKTLHCTLTLDLDIGEERYLNVPLLGLDGNNWVTEISTTLSPEGCYEDVSIEYYKDMEVPS